MDRLYAMGVSLPLSNPIEKFLIILLLILITPLLLNKIKVPPLLGLIIAGAIVGPKGFNLIERDSGIILSGTAGLLYIMFLAGLEIDMAEFKRNSKKSLIFGLLTFCIPMILGIVAGIYFLHFSITTSVLLASMFASHTLIAYPMISKIGIAKNRAVTITVGGTIITDVLALLVLALIVGMEKGEVNASFWVRLSLGLLFFSAIVTVVFPRIARWFFKHFQDGISQYIFVLMLVFLGAVLAELAGIEGIIGAFLTGLSINKLIAHSSPLMNRIDFVGNAIFIPFFLLGVGMLIDYTAFISDIETIKVALIMIAVATVSKYTAAWISQKAFSFSKDERRVMFGLSNAQAAATLAAVLVGYNTVIDTSDTGEPIRLLNENVLNGTILMILVTCTMATFVAQKGAKNMALEKSKDNLKGIGSTQERILIPIYNLNTTEELVQLGLTLKSDKKENNLYALTVIDHKNKDNSSEKTAEKLMKKASDTVLASGHTLKEIYRYDINTANAIVAVTKEHKISDMVLGLHNKQEISDTFLGGLTDEILEQCNTTTFIYKPVQPINTVHKHHVIIPKNAEKEIGFPLWLIKLWNMAKNLGVKLAFYGTLDTLHFIKAVQLEHPLDCNFVTFNKWKTF